MSQIAKEDAIKKAQDFLRKESFEEEFYVTKVLRVEDREWGEDGDQWVVYFKSRKTINGNKIITVNKFTGDVKDRGRTKW